GTVVTEPVPETVIERTGAEVALCAPDGMPTPANATATPNTAATAASRTSFMVRLPRSVFAYTVPRATASRCRCAEQLQVRPPAVGDRRRREPDVEHRGRRPRNRPQGHRDLLR